MYCLFIIFYTCLSVPGPVRNLTFEVIPQSEGNVRINWVAPAVTNGDIVSYEVTYGELHGTDMKLTVSHPPAELTNLSESIQVQVENSLTQLVKCLCYSHSWSDSI